MDKLSNLHNDLILHIVSFLPAKEAAFTTILSKRWQKLFTIESDLVFDQSINNVEGSFKNFVGELSAKPASHRVRRFSLKLTHVDDSQYNLVNECLRNVLKRGVMNLELDIKVVGDYSLPDEIFFCKSVVRMRLGSGLVIDAIPKNALLPSLETIVLESVQFNSLDGCAFQRLTSVCPSIKELVMDGHSFEDRGWLKIFHTLQFQIYDLQWFCDFSKAVPVFENLNHLSVATLLYVCWDAIKIVLEKSPKLKTLTIEGPLHYYPSDDPLVWKSVCVCLNGYSFLVSCRIEVLKLIRFGGDPGEMVQLKLVLKNLKSLNLLEVVAQASGDDEKTKIRSKLLRLARACKLRKVHIKFST